MYYGTPDDIQARLAKEQYADWETRYKPLESDLRGMVRGSTGEIASDAGKAAAQSTMTAALSADRNAKKMGVNLTPEQAKAQNAQRRLGLSANVADAKANARQGAEALQESTTRQMMVMGRGIQGNAMDGMSQAANMQISRDRNNDQIKASDRAAKTSAGVTLGSAALMLLALSDEKKKKNIKPMSGKKALKDIRGMNIREWEYKDKPGKHIGEMAQTAPDSIKGPDLTLNVHDEANLAMRGMQELLARVEKLEGSKNGG